MRFRSSHRVWLGGAALAAGLALVPVSAQQAPAERVAYDATGTRGDGGTLFAQGAAAANRQPNADTGLPAIVIAVEHYGRIVRTLPGSRCRRRPPDGAAQRSKATGVE